MKLYFGINSIQIKLIQFNSYDINLLKSKLS